MLTNSFRPIDILLVEDDDEDVELIVQSLARDRVVNQLNRVRDGQEAIAYLSGTGDFAGVASPDLMLLDLNMPRMDGREVLEACVGNDALKDLPIVVFISSAEDKIKFAKYGSRISSFVHKPIDLLKFRQVLRDTNQFWFCIAKDADVA